MEVTVRARCAKPPPTIGKADAIKPNAQTRPLNLRRMLIWLTIRTSFSSRTQGGDQLGDPQNSENPISRGVALFCLGILPPGDGRHAKINNSYERGTLARSQFPANGC